MNRHKLLRRAHYLASLLVPYRTPRPSDEPIDVVIPVTEKDLDTLPLAIEGVRRHATNRIAAIYIVARDTEAIRGFCRERGVVFVDETSVLGYTPQHLALTVCDPPIDRSGWLFQQLLKLSGRIGDSPWFVVIDADHVLLRPHTFVCADGRSVLYRSAECHAPYYDNIRTLLRTNITSHLSYVAHKMVFNRKALEQLRADIERANAGMRWDEAILNSIDRNNISGFSEFELYGNWLPSSGKIHRPWRNHHYPASHLADNDTLERRYGWKYAAVTFPSYLK